MRIVTRFTRTASIAVLCLSAVPFAACSSSADAQEPEQRESQAKTDETAQAHKGGRMFEEVLKELKLRPEQQTEVDKLRAERKERHAPVKAAKHELMKALADQIEKGDVDRCALRPGIDKLGAAVAKANPEDRAAMDRFHAILDPEQRATFVDSLRQRFQAMKKAHGSGEMMDAVSKEMNLSDDQKVRLAKIFGGLRDIKEAEPGHAAHIERMTKILDAFKGESFVLDEIDPARDVAAEAASKIKHVLWAGEAVLPVLNAEQRVHLAKLIRGRAERHHHDTGKDDGTARDEMPTTD